MTTQRVPSCPDCGEPGKHIKDNRFRCSDPHCGAVWEEVDWQERLDREHAFHVESEKLREINSLVAILDFRCVCGKAIRYGDSYCHNENLKERYCVDCSLKAGYMKMVRNKKTGEEYPAMLVSSKREELAEVSPSSVIKVNSPDYSDELCKRCGKPLIKIKMRKATPARSGQYTLACDNISCSIFRQPQGHGAYY